ncbi:MAG: endonuclease III domain-containing protein [Geminicoccaceae bacterium]
MAQPLKTKKMPAADLLLDDAEIDELFARLKSISPDSRKRETVKDDRVAFRALVSCLLSAQSRDSNTAKAKNALFALADTPAGILALDDRAIVEAIRPAGLYNIKTRNLRRLCTALIDDHDEVVPRDRRGLMALPGIGRKCADIILSFSFGEPVLAVDTHVHRVANRIGLAHGRTEAETAASLEARAPHWAGRESHMWLLRFGKTTCRSRAPRCPDCVLRDLCRYERKTTA